MQRSSCNILNLVNENTFISTIGNPRQTTVDDSAIPLSKVSHVSSDESCIRQISNTEVITEEASFLQCQAQAGLGKSAPQLDANKISSECTKEAAACKVSNESAATRESAENLEEECNNTSRSFSSASPGYSCPQTPACFDETSLSLLDMPFLSDSPTPQKKPSGSSPVVHTPKVPSAGIKDNHTSSRISLPTDSGVCDEAGRPSKSSRLMDVEMNDPRRTLVKKDLGSLKPIETLPSLLETPSKAFSQDVSLVFKTPSTRADYHTSINTPFLETPGKCDFPSLQTPFLNDPTVSPRFDSLSLETPIVGNLPSRPVTPEIDETLYNPTSEEKADGMIINPLYNSFSLTRSIAAKPQTHSTISTDTLSEVSLAEKSKYVTPLEAHVKCDLISLQTPIRNAPTVSSGLPSQSLETPIIGNLPTCPITPEVCEFSYQAAHEHNAEDKPSNPSICSSSLATPIDNPRSPSLTTNPGIETDSVFTESSIISVKPQSISATDVLSTPLPVSVDVDGTENSGSNSPSKIPDLINLEPNETPMETEDIEIIDERPASRSSTYGSDQKATEKRQNSPEDHHNSVSNFSHTGYAKPECAQSEENIHSVLSMKILESSYESEKCEIVLSNISIPAEGGFLSQIVAESSVCKGPQNGHDSPILCTVDSSSLITTTKDVNCENVHTLKTDQSSPLNSNTNSLLTPTTHDFVTPPKKILPKRGPDKFRAIRKSPYKALTVKTSPILRKHRKFSPKKFLRRKKPAFILPRKRVLRAKLQNLLSSSATTIPPGNSINKETISGNHFDKRYGANTLAEISDPTIDKPEIEFNDESCALLIEEDRNENVNDEKASKKSAPSSQIDEEEEDLDLIDEEDEIDDDDDIDQQQKDEHLAALLKASSTIHSKRSERRVTTSSSSKTTQKLNKQQRSLQARIDALARVPDSEMQSKALSLSYIIRVRDALLPNDRVRFEQFISLLRNFEEHPYSPENLYFKIVDLLKDFPLLCDEFVAFLMPHQAQSVGKFSEYCAVQRMMEFVDKLQHHFGRDSPDVPKVIRMMQSIQKKSMMDFDEMKNLITPILRYPHLIESFMQCFPTQAPTQSLADDFEEVNFDTPGTPDNAENINLLDEDFRFSPDHCTCACHSNTNQGTHTLVTQGKSDHCVSCGLRFIDGRVYLQCGKTLRPAKVTYLAKKEEAKTLPHSSAHPKHKSKKSHTKDSSAMQNTKPKHDKANKASQKPNSSECHGQTNASSESEAAILGEKQRTDEGNQDEKINAPTKERKSSKESRAIKSSGTKGPTGKGKAGGSSSKKTKESAASSRKRDEDKEKAKINKVRKKSGSSLHKTPETILKSSDHSQTAKLSNAAKLKTSKLSQSASSPVGTIDADSKNSKSDQRNPLSSKLITLELQKIPRDESWTIEDDFIILGFLKEKESPESLNSLLARFPSHSSEQIEQRLKTIASFILNTLSC